MEILNEIEVAKILQLPSLRLGEKQAKRAVLDLTRRKDKPLGFIKIGKFKRFTMPIIEEFLRKHGRDVRVDPRTHRAYEFDPLSGKTIQVSSAA